MKIENRKEILTAFQISKLIIFEVNYYTLGGNEKAHFATNANKFIKSKRDYNECGQAQDNLLPKNSIAYIFFKKWDFKHCQDLTLEEYQEMTKDLELLKNKYNFIEKEPTQHRTNISFYDLVELSKKDLKKEVR